MNTIRKNVLIALTVLGLGATTFQAQAQTTAADTQPTREQMHAKWAERAAMHQKKMHDQLMLTPSQEAAWASYIAAARPAMRGERAERGQWQSMSAPQRMEKRIEMAKRHLAMMETRLAALNTFYAVLTPEQKKVFDASHQGRGKWGGHRGHHGHHGMKQQAAS